MPHLQSQTATLSEDVQEIIFTRSSWMVRNGIWLLLLIGIAIISVSHFIRYPDVVPVQARLTSINAPKPVVCTNGGKLIKLLAIEDQSVQKGEAIAWLESNARHETVQKLQYYLTRLETLLDSNRIEHIADKGELYLPTADLGELQQPYQTFSQAYTLFSSYINGGFYLKKMVLLQNDRNYLQQLLTHLQEQETLQTEDLQLTEKTYAANEGLKADKVISDFDLRNERSKLIGKQLSLPQIHSTIIENQSQQNEKTKEMMELENTIAQQKAIFTQAIYTLQSAVNDWSLKYELKAPVTGIVAFTSFVEEGQQLKTSQTICYINPGNSSYYAEAIVPQANFGKITDGQLVLLKFAAYPSAEFGTVKGQITFISRIPLDSGYVAKVTLPKGLVTNYNKEVQYREGLKASGEIVTRNSSLLRRFYYSITGHINN